LCDRAFAEADASFALGRVRIHRTGLYSLRSPSGVDPAHAAKRMSSVR
jgi:hypothetical protein